MTTMYSSKRPPRRLLRRLIVLIMLAIVLILFIIKLLVLILRTMHLIIPCTKIERIVSKTTYVGNTLACFYKFKHFMVRVH